MSDQNNTKSGGASGKLAERAVGPAADEFGKAVAPLGERAGKLTVYVGDKLLGMLEASVFGLERVAEWVKAEVSKRLKDVPDEKITEPNPRIAVPAVQALTYSMGEEHIREMFANLLSADMNSDLKESAHPAFVEIIKEMTPMDARVLGSLRRYPQIEFRVRLGTPAKWNEMTIHYSFELEHISTAQITTSISNLERLGLMQVRSNEYPLHDDFDDKEKKISAQYEGTRQQLAEIRKQLKASAEAEAAAALNAMPEGDVFLTKNGIYLTPLGTVFASVCLPKND